MILIFYLFCVFKILVTLYASVYFTINSVFLFNAHFKNNYIHIIYHSKSIQNISLYGCNYICTWQSGTYTWHLILMYIHTHMYINIHSYIHRHSLHTYIHIYRYIHVYSICTIIYTCSRLFMYVHSLLHNTLISVLSFPYQI